MVMEIPTPQCVGREFVRQYYTLLNKAPLHLHRFYNHDSSFLHGGLDHPGQETHPVVGQHDIHERIMQLNFRDCHAKIVSVDSLETLGDGVVVQVTGELSNNGQPMRRFMQTFVLVPQSPKKYYVRNDIFRYQDEIFSEDDNDLDNEESTTRTSTIDQDDDNAVYHENEIVRNGSVYGSDSVLVSSMNDHLVKYSPPQAPLETVASPPPDMEEAPKAWEVSDEEDEEEEEDLEGEDSAPERVEEEPTQEILAESPPVVSQEPKTYANMVSRNASSSMTPNAPVSSTTSPVSTSSVPQKLDHGLSYPKTEGTPSSFPQTGAPRPSRSRLNSGRSVNRFDSTHERSPEDMDVDRRKPAFVHYPDSQQLFVGNLTHSITEDDLKQHFTKFGRVLDMRINTKQTQKVGGGKVPNFGFIVFEEPDSVQKVLGARPIYFNDHRLNVEEKKRPKDNRMIMGDNQRGPPRGGGPSPRIVGGRGRGIMAQNVGRGESRGGMRGTFAPRR